MFPGTNFTGEEDELEIAEKFNHLKFLKLSFVT